MADRKIFFSAALVAGLALGNIAAHENINAKTPPELSAADVDGLGNLNVQNEESVIPEYSTEPNCIGEFPNIPQEKPIWRVSDRPTSITIPKLVFSGEIEQIKDKDPDPNAFAFDTPIVGLGTPENLSQTILVFAHSRIKNKSGEKEITEWANISKLTKGDLICLVREAGEPVTFSVTDFALYDRDEQKINTYDETTLLLQTSAANKGQDWILFAPDVLQRAGRNRPQSLEGNLVFVVVAKPSEMQIESVD